MVIDERSGFFLPHFRRAKLFAIRRYPNIFVCLRMPVDRHAPKKQAVFGKSQEIDMSDKNIETITHGLEPIALIIRADYDEPGIQFFTPGRFSQQVAYMKHP
jgi:hypothetical protein